MNAIRRMNAVCSVWVRTLVLALAFALGMQGAFAQFLAVGADNDCHRTGAASMNHEHGGSHHAMDSGQDHDAQFHEATVHDDAGHVSHPSDNSGQDNSHGMKCCGWMCTAAICVEHVAMDLPQAKAGRASRYTPQMPHSGLAYGLHRPPIFQTRVI